MALCEETIYQIALTRIKGMNLLLAKTLLDTIGSASETVSYTHLRAHET